MSTAVSAGTYLHHMQLLSGDPAGLAAFYADAMDMTARPQDGEGWIAEGPGRRVLFARGADKTLGYCAFACRDGEGLAAIRARAEVQGAAILPSPSPLFGAEAFAVRDPDGNTVAFGLGGAEPPRKGLRGPLQHLTLATQQPEAIEAFYTGTLGFLTSDYVRDAEGRVQTCWMRSNHEHHTMACFRHSRQGIDHHSYEAGDWSVIKDWCDRMGDRRIRIIWGPGRHGPGNNLFLFIEDPDGNWIEVSAELEVVYGRPAGEWPHEERSLNLWGHGILRT
ncbi:VOC family protein [Pararoseomonas sp. SCSIO 73927]|uniref:VOC family protein n=1 Tax=Pararoseomonas sp. SCSIO 73927 TaxID=3114537 RepID=UPI0030CC3343